MLGTELNYIIDLYRAEINWCEVFDLAKVSNEIDSVRESGGEPEKINIIVEFPKDMRLYDIPLVFKSKEDNNMVEKLSEHIKQCYEIRNEEDENIKIEKHVKLIKALNRLITLEDRVENLLIKIGGDPCPHEVGQDKSLEDKIPLATVLRDSPEFIENKISGINGFLDNIEKELF